MGTAAVNATFRVHAQATSADDTVEVHFHHDNNSWDETHAIPLGTWSALRSSVRAANRSQFETDIQAAFTPSFAWTNETEDATWRAAVLASG